MKKRARQNKKGFSLMEFMVAVLILTVGLLSLLETICLSMNHSAGNKLRQEAILIADREMMAVRSFDFNSITNKIESRTPRNSFVNYSVATQVSDITTRTKNVAIRVTWREKGLKKEYYLTTVINAD